MTTELTFADFGARLRDFIRASPGFANSTETQFNELALALFRLQFQHNVAYRRLCEARGVLPQNISAWREIPAVPASAFKEMELTSLPFAERTTVFLSSGTTEQRRSRHFHSGESLAIYEASLLPWFERHLLADVNDLVDEQLLGPLDKLPLVALTPPPTAAPNSSLVHMFETVRREFGSRDSLFTGRVDANGAWILDMDATLFAIRKSMCANRPLVLLGTAFNFVHLIDHFAANNIRYRLARGSRVLETGGYKGQSREVPKAELHALITKHLGIASECIVTEYGMSELSSQAYDGVASSAPSPLNRERSPRTTCALGAPELAQCSVLANAPFPLTPALSPAERENPRPSVRPTQPFGMVERLDAELPLPKGEGWGEGEGRATTPNERLSKERFMGRVGARDATAAQPSARKDPPHLTPALSPPSGSGEGEGMTRLFHFPPWVRSQIISPETGREVSDGETGLIRIFDLANVRSVMGIQTEDLGVRRGDGFELIGRAVQAEPRGCSLMSLNAEAQRRQDATPI